MSEFGERLRTERVRCGFDQAKLAKLAGRSGQSFISNLEKGSNKSTSSVVELAHALGVDAYWLKTGKGHRLGNQENLSQDEREIITGFRLLSEETRSTWLLVARDRIAKENAAKSKAA